MNAIAISQSSRKPCPSLSQDETDFLALFTQDGPLFGAIHGPILANGKVDWTSSNTKWKLSRTKFIEWWQDSYYVIGKRFRWLTSYVVLDIDKVSQYHPTHDETALDRLLKTLEDIGLVRSLIVRSSQSEGIHVYFPFEKPVNSLHAAKVLASHLTQSGFQIQNGQLEIFPNVRQSKNFNGIRLPLQAGSYLLNPITLQPETNSARIFVQQWQCAAKGNDVETFIRAPWRTKQAPSASLKSSASPVKQGNSVPPFAFTGCGQTNDILGRLTNWGIEKLNLWDEAFLAQWMKGAVQALPGYVEFASPDSKEDIERGDWCDRWAKCGVDYHKSYGWQYRQKNHQQTGPVQSWNDYQHEQSTTRLQRILSTLQAEIEAGTRSAYYSISPAIADIIDYAKATTGTGFSKKTLYAHKTATEIKAAIVRPLAQSEFNTPPPTVENNATRVYRLPHKDLNAVHPKNDAAKKPPISEEQKLPMANKTAVAGGVIAAKADGEPYRQPSNLSPEQLNTELAGSVEENAQSLTYRRSDMTKPIDELVQQRIKKDLAAKNGTQAEIAERHGVSISTVKRIAKSIRPVTQVAENISGAIAQGALGQGEVSELNYGQILTQVIIKLEASIALAEPKSLEAVASCLMKALILHREFMTTRQAVDWILDLPDFDPREFTRILKEEYGNRRARQSI
ncbi:transposase family protein [Halomicronema sp. CCY15110]|uniref:transposase family protein n=1 Tax=Halomicronema sp. CCY15110 TaxID=2767773 RepID=UPI001950AB1A|nr:transposase family protein [Halomicronema sp. CCY15110]